MGDLGADKNQTDSGDIPWLPGPMLPISAKNLSISETWCHMGRGFPPSTAAAACNMFP